MITEEGEKARVLSNSERCRLWCRPIVALVQEACRRLKEHDGVEACALELLTKLMEKDKERPRWFGKGFSRRDGVIFLKASSRLTTAAALVYIASFLKGKNATQNEVADLFGISNVGLRGKFHRIRDLLDLPI